MNKRIRKCLREEDLIDKKIAELMAQKADLEVARGQEEEKEIVKIIRGMKLDKHELADLLDGLQSGEITLLKNDNLPDEDDGSTDADEDEDYMKSALENALEREASYGDQTIE